MSAACVGVTVFLASLSDRPADHFSRDPLAVMNAPAYVGMLSNITVMAWFAAAGAAWLIASAVDAHSAARRRSWAMGCVAAVLAILGIDDLFMIHEELLQRHAGVPEVVTMGVYALLVAGIAVAYRDVWRRSVLWLLVPAAFLLGASVVVDVLTTGFGWRLVIEDSLKFLGVSAIGAWVLATGMAWLSPSAATAAIETRQLQERGSMSASNTA